MNGDGDGEVTVPLLVGAGTAGTEPVGITSWPSLVSTAAGGGVGVSTADCVSVTVAVSFCEVIAVVVDGACVSVWVSTSS